MVPGTVSSMKPLASKSSRRCGDTVRHGVVSVSLLNGRRLALGLSGITVAASRNASDVTLHEDVTTRAAHGMHPTANRRLGRGDVVSLFAEVYSNDQRMTAGDLTVTAIVTESQLQNDVVADK